MSNCNCLGVLNTNSTTTSPTCVVCGDCLIAPDIILFGNNSVTPCGNTGTYTIEITESNCFCTGGYSFDIISSDTAFDVISLSNAGVLSFSFDQNATLLGMSYNIVYKLTCLDPLRASFGTVQILANDICSTLICPAGQECDPCTGNCTASATAIDLATTINT